MILSTVLPPLRMRFVFEHLHTQCIFWDRQREVERERDLIDLAFAFLLTVADVVSKLNGALRLDSVNYVRSSIDFLGATILQDKFLQATVAATTNLFFSQIKWCLNLEAHLSNHFLEGIAAVKWYNHLKCQVMRRKNNVC